VTVWELATGKEVSPLPAHRDPIRAVALAPDCQVLASVASGGGGSAALTLWQVPTGRELRRLAGPGGPVPAVFFSACGRLVISGPGADGAVRRWEAGTGKELPYDRGPFPKAARALAVSPDSQAFAVSVSDHTVHLYDSRSGKRRGTLGIAPGAGQVLALSPGARRVAYAAGGGAVVMADTARGKVL
jgi:WD40 repeat protein